MKKMTGFATKVLTLVLAAALVLGTNGVRALAVDAGEAETATATAAVIAEVAETQPAEGTAPIVTTGPAIIVNPAETEEPTAEKVLDYYMVFSIAKADRVDKSSGTTFDGLKEIDYFQIKGVDKSDSWDRLYNEKHPNKNKDNKIEKTKRYNIRVNEAEIDGFMTEVLNDVVGPTETVTQLNETDGNKIEAYPVERTAQQSDKRGMVEAVLTKMGVLDEVTTNVQTFVRNKNNGTLQKYLKEVYPDINFDSNDWYIDWYVMKTQDNGIHVDGVFVTIYDLDEWTVVYNFVKVVDGEDEIVCSVPLDDTYSVRKGDKPEFTNDNVIETVSDITDKYTQEQCTLRVNEDGSKFIFVENEETNKKTIEIFYELKEEKAEQPGDPVNPQNPSEEPKDEPKQDDEPQDGPKDDPQQNDDPTPDPVVPSAPVFVPDEPEEEPAAEELPVEEPKTPESAPEEEEIPVEESKTPEGAPVEEEPEEEIPVEVPVTPEGAPEEEEEEEIPVDIPATPEGDVLPQTGVASAAVFFGFGAGFIAIGAAVIGKFARKEEI